MRIGCRNINGFPIDASHPKNDEICLDINSNNFDVFGITEVNLSWRNLLEKDRIASRFRGKFEFSKKCFSYNNDPDIKAQFLYGGTMCLANGSCSGRVIETGKDPCQLGRWSWLLLRGRNQRLLRIVTVYRPVVSNGSTSTYQQHKLFLNTTNIDTCPRQQMLIDLQVSIDKWHEEGNQLIVMGDFNEDVQGIRVQQYFGQWGLKEVIISKHGNDAPNTFRDGSKPIDGIFCSRDIAPVRGGYSSFEWGTKTDHRLLWVDLDLVSIFGSVDPPLWSPQARRLKLLDPRIVNKFLQSRLGHAATNNLLQLVQALYEKITENGLQTEDIEEIEKLDAIRVEGILTADRKCRKIKAGEVPWSPLLQGSINRIRYYRVCIAKYKRMHNIKNNTLRKYLHQADLTEPITNLETAETKLKEEYLTYKEIKKGAKDKRKNYLEDIAFAQADQDEDRAATILKTILEHEKQRELGRRLRYILGRPRAGVTCVEAPSDQGGFITVTVKEEIELACQQENITRFTQANNTPSLLEDQINLLGWTAQTECSQHILDGNDVVIDPLLHPDIKRLVPFLQMNAITKNLEDIDATISEQQYCNAWRRCKEYTSSGKSGLHFGHFKASLNDDTLMNIDRLLAEISLTTGYALSRWKIGIDVMIPKKADSQRVDKLRTIVLMEADFNFLNKLIGKRVMIQAERTNSLADEQYGSRKKKSSILHATNKQLVFDIIRQKKQDVALIVLDAKSCYDRISPPIASLCLRRCGAPQSMCEMMFSTIDEMRHYTRTSFGDSEGWYQRQDQRFHGILQGNGAGPAMWATISSPLLDRLREEGFGVQIKNHNTNKSVTIPAFAFVDDTDLIQEITSKEDYITQAQDMLNVWDSSLRATGGALVAEKCSWFLVKHRWQNNKWELLSKADSPGALQMTNHDGTFCPLTRYEPDEAVSALGLMFSPSGDNSAQLQMLLDKAHRWAEIIKHSGLSRNDVWYSLNTMILKSLEYSMLASTLSQSDLHTVMSCILKVGLSKSGICRTIAREAVYATNKYFGFDINDLYVTQGIRKLRLLLNPQTVTTRHLLSTAFDLLCVEAGVGINVLESKWFDVIITYTTTGWITSLGKFLFDYNITLHKKHENQYRFQRDDFLMHKAMVHGIKGKALKLFNACRLFLQVSLISDIITADGKSIKKHIWNGDKSAHDIQGEWPRQPKPDNRGWIVWKNVLRKIFDFRIDNIFLNGIGIIQYPINWMWYYSESDSRVYRKQQDQYEVYSIQRQTHYRSRRNQRRFVLTENVIPLLPEDSRICTIYYIGNDIMVDGIGGWAASSHHQVLSPDLWTNTINNIIVGDKEDFLQAWRNGTLIMVSDGSAKDSVATGAWIISSEALYREGKYIEGSALSNGPSSIQDSHRGECIGLLGGLYTITTLLDEWHDDSGSITIGCDNQSALYYAFDTERYPNIDPTYPDFDILSSIRFLMKSTISYFPKHVKGHQDQLKGPLDIYAKFNIRADFLANVRRENTSVQTFCDQAANIQFPGEMWQVHVGEIKVCRHLPISIKEFISSRTMEEMWSRRTKLSTTTFSLVDWEAVEGAMKETRTTRRHWIIKHALEECGINTVLKKRKEKTDSTCRRCGSEETATHVWQCQDTQVQEIWSKSIANMISFLEDLNTDPVITNEITTNLLNWYNGTVQLCEDDSSPIFSQQRIGWQFLLEGWIGKHWRVQQSKYLHMIKSKKSSLRWTIAVIKKLWDIAWDLWEHRNGVEHMHDTTVAHELLNRQIEIVFDEFDAGSGVSYAYMFSDDEHQLLQIASIAYKRAWIRNVTAAQQRAQRRAVSSTELSRMQNVMRFFLTQGREIQR